MDEQVNSEQKEGFWLADCEIKPATNELFRSGKSISLEPKVMALLVLLASKPGEVFSRQELEQQLWKGSIVGYDALAKAVNKLREALGDDSRQPKFIQTIPKKGYRLVAEKKLDKLSKGVHSEEAGDRQEKHSGVQAAISRLPHFIIIVVLLLAGSFIFIKLHPVIETVNLPVKTSSQAPAITGLKPTIVVLPFYNISQSDKDDYLADGLTSDLTTNLSKLSGIWVTSSRSTLAYKDTRLSYEKIRSLFNARYVIDGEVNRINKKIRINVHLADVDSGTILWAERYDRDFTDLFAIQDEVTQNIISRLSLTLTREEKKRVAKRYTNNLAAYEIFLRAQSIFYARNGEDNESAQELFRKAIDLDPSFARAYAALSYSYTIASLRSWKTDTQQPLKKASRLAKQAIALDHELPESYWSEALVYFYLNDKGKCIKSLEKALSINPNFANAYALLGTTYTAMGRPGYAIEFLSRAYRLNPAGGSLYDIQAGRAHLFLNNNELALNYFLSGYNVNPANIDILMYLTVVYVRLERMDDAVWMLDEAKQQAPGFDYHKWVRDYPYDKGMGYREILLGAINRAIEYKKNIH